MRTGHLRIAGLGKTFRGETGPTEAMRAIDLNVAPGEFVTVVGPSGCGKSTLLNLVAGLEEPTTGTVELDGVPMLGPGPDRIMVFQDGALFPWLDVRRNVEFGLRIAGVPRDERAERALEVLRTMQIEGFARARIHELSGGMRQRVALARALVLRPKVLLLDEPFASLDAQMRDELLGVLQDLWRGTGATVMFVTHNIREAACLGDRVVVLSRRPGTVKGIVANSAPRPRRIEDEEVMERVRDVNRLVAEEIRWSHEQELRH